MTRTLVVRYRTHEELAEENRRLVEDVFTELNSRDPGGVRYAVLQLVDGADFVHIVVFDGDGDGDHDGDHDDSNSNGDQLTDLEAFQKFQATAGDRIVGKPVVSEASIVGSYRFWESSP